MSPNKDNDLTEEIKKELPKEVPVQEADGTVRTKVRPKLIRREVVDGKPKLGRPKKADIVAKKRGHRGAIGRPAGDAARIAEFKARLLGTAGDKIIRTLIEKALDPNDKDQIAALKMCVDRVLPLSAFDASKQSGGTPQISINITGLTGTIDHNPVLEMTADEVEYKEVNE
jgi:hypothetical protein